MHRHSRQGRALSEMGALDGMYQGRRSLRIVMLGEWSVASGLLAYNNMSDGVKFLLDLYCH